jgi:phage RecT family recombinase
MPDGNNHLVTTSAHDLATMPFEQAIDVYTPNFAAALPEHISVDHFKRMIITAVNLNPDLRYADRRTLFNSAVKCASDGLLPDGRDAALVIYKTKVKNREGGDQWIDAVQYLPMVAGIRKRMRNSGDVLSAEAEVVCRNDRFRYARGDNSFIEHEPPSDLTVDRGEPVGAYAIIKLKNGEVIREVMRKHDIEKRRNQSKAPNSLMWKDYWEEGAMKTVLKHAGKAAPQSASLEFLQTLASRDEELPELPKPEDLPALPARPQRADYVEHGAQPVLWVVVDADGEELEFPTAAMAAEKIRETFEEAKRRGRGALDGAAESNEYTLRQMSEGDHADLAQALVDLWREQRDTLDPFGQRAQPKEPAQPHEAADPTLPQLKHYDDKKPRWPEFAHDNIVAMREADRDRLAQLWQAAEPQLKGAPQSVKRDIERAHADRLQALAGEAA